METLQQGKNPKRGEKDWERIVFLVLLAIIPLGVLVSLGWLNFQILIDPDRREASKLVTQTQADGVVTTIITTTYLSPTVGLGAFDPALGKVANYAIGPVSFLIGTIIEMSLLLVFGSFYLRRSKDGQVMYGPEQDLVRIFLVIIVSLTILTFAFLPSQWGDNKAVVFLFGLLSTVVGFYFGAQSASASKNPPDGGTGAKAVTKAPENPPPDNQSG